MPWTRSALLATVFVAACLSPSTPLQRLTDSAYDFNLATRFGRTDVALENVSRDEQASFSKRHETWGAQLRIVDSEVIEIARTDDGVAQVTVDIQWHRANESLIHATRLRQAWKDIGPRWVLEGELAVAGDAAIFERQDLGRAPRPFARALATKVIRE